MLDLLAKVNINDILQFLQECDFYNKRFTFFKFMSVGWDVKPCPVSRITKKTKKTASLDFDKEWAREGRHGNFKITQLITFN